MSHQVKGPVSISKQLLSIIIQVSIFFFAAFASAQQPEQGNSSQESGIDEILVTAQKRSESIQDVPISMVAFSGAQLEKSGVETLMDLQYQVPNLGLSQSVQPSNTIITIRGVGSNGNTAIESSVGTFIDGVYYARPGSVLGNLFDIQSAEVLRGPQGTLFGRNTPMGALNITTALPSQETEIKLRAGYGAYDARFASGVVSGGLSDSVAGRLAVKVSERDGYGRTTFAGAGPTGDFGDREDVTVRTKLRFTPSDDWDIVLAADYNEIDQGSTLLEILPETNPQFPNFNQYIGRSIALFGDALEIGDPEDYTINQPVRDQTHDEQWGVSADIQKTIGEHTLRSITAYRDWENSTLDIDFLAAADFLLRDGIWDNESFSQELQLISPAGKQFEYVLGLFYYDEDYSIDEAFNLGSQFCGFVPPPLRPLCSNNTLEEASTVSYSQNLESFAAFGQATFNFNDQWSLTGGIRYTDDSKDAVFQSTADNPILSALGFRIPFGPQELSRSDSEVTWMVNLRYSPRKDLMFYGLVSTGFKSGGFNSGGGGTPLTAEQRSFDPESTTNYEIGVKSTWMEGLLVANLTFYRTEVEDLQDRSFDPGTVEFLVRNAAELTQQGVEFDLRFRPIDPLLFAFSGAYLDSEFDSYPGASALPGGLPQDLAGERNHFSPKWQTATAVQWDGIIPDTALNWSLRGEYNWRDDANLGSNVNANPQGIQDDYGLLNLRASLGSEDGAWKLTVFGENLTDEAYCSRTLELPLGGPMRAVDPVTNTSVMACSLGVPRTWGVEAEYKF